MNSKIAGLTEMTFQKLVHMWVKDNRPDLVYQKPWAKGKSAFIHLKSDTEHSAVVRVDLDKIFIITTLNCLHNDSCPKWRQYSMYNQEIFNVLRDLKDCRKDFKDC